jgi:hypothetical protein
LAFLLEERRVKMRKTIVIGISLLFFIGIVSQAFSARKIHCWDDNIQNYQCDPEEDINGDGKCNKFDCETEEPCYAVQQTGQTTCYDIDGDPIGCADTGQDGEYLYGTPWPEPRFTDNLNGTVTDNLTGLIWLQIANCGGTKTWADALTFANSLYDEWTGDGSGGDCGLSDDSLAGDWRLPNVRELHSLIHYEYYNPALPNTAGTGQWTDEDPFTGVHGYYWSSTTYPVSADFAFYVGVSYGHVLSNPKDNYHYVWPVRGGN